MLAPRGSLPRRVFPSENQNWGDARLRKKLATDKGNWWLEKLGMAGRKM